MVKNGTQRRRDAEFFFLSTPFSSVPLCLCGEKWYTETQRLRVFFLPTPFSSVPLCLCGGNLRYTETQRLRVFFLPTPLSSVPPCLCGGKEVRRVTDFTPHKPLCASASLCTRNQILAAICQIPATISSIPARIFAIPLAKIQHRHLICKPQQARR